MIDQSIANTYIALEDTADGGMTNGITFLVRPERFERDESNADDTGLYLAITLTREEVRQCLADLDKDWADHEKFALGLPA